MSQPPNRRWLQFSLRTLFVLMLLVAAFFGGRESMRPTIRAERHRADQARHEALVSRAQAMMDAELARAAELQARKALDQSPTAMRAAAEVRSGKPAPDGSNGSAPPDR